LIPANWVSEHRYRIILNVKGANAVSTTQVKFHKNQLNALKLKIFYGLIDQDPLCVEMKLSIRKRPEAFEFRRSMLPFILSRSGAGICGMHFLP
jgi:hypothetical protein